LANKPTLLVFTASSVWGTLWKSRCSQSTRTISDPTLIAVSLSACHRWRPSWERETISRSLGSSFKFNHNTQGWKAEPKAFPWSEKELSQFDPERQAKTEAWKRKARELEKLEERNRAVEELEAELNDLIKKGEAESSGMFPLVPSAKSCFPKPIHSGNTLNQELSSDEDDPLHADLGIYASQKKQSGGSGSAKRERDSPEHSQEACEVKAENDRGEDLGFKQSQFGGHLQGAQEHLDDQAAHLRGKRRSCLRKQTLVKG